MIRLPGLIDIRCGIAPGDNWRDSGSTALAGGYTTIIGLAAPSEALNTPERVTSALTAAADACPCDYALLYQVDGLNARDTNAVKDQVAGLYLDFTTQPGKTAPDMHLTTNTLRSWHSQRPVCVRGSAEQIGAAIFTANMQLKPIHICDVTTKAQLEIILESRQNGMRVSCDVALHTLFFSQEVLADFPAKRAGIIPPVGSEADRAFLWKNIQAVDCLTSGHLQPSNADTGYPALETAIPLLMQLVNGKYLTLEDIQQKLNQNPTRIFGLQPQGDTYIEIDEKLQTTVEPSKFHSELKISPYRGMTFPGQLVRTVVRGSTVYDREKGLAADLHGENALAPTMTPPAV